MFYERLTALCKQHNTSVSVFVRDVLKLNSSSATGWKRGSSPRADVILETARYFGVSTDYLLGVTDDPALHLGDIAMLYRDRSKISTIAEAALNTEMQNIGCKEDISIGSFLDPSASREDIKMVRDITEAFWSLPPQAREHAGAAIQTLIKSYCAILDDSTNNHPAKIGEDVK